MGDAKPGALTRRASSRVGSHLLGKVLEGKGVDVLGLAPQHLPAEVTE
eukprot:CAMPEP_0118886286 /NCGR_PEP_ID=MMETSP1163-20130328/24427_1 /TAXON_ID=124430 /ORGANISM="Phaeomonas parva, Strain CCMP2877" /LENGTH=47 /DNA_ID= /DNA_START= /DNA_END= /DNA_ORIENTATION=